MEPFEHKSWILRHVLGAMIVVLFIVMFGANWLYEDAVRGEISQRLDGVSLQLDGLRSLMMARGLQRKTQLQP